MHLIEVISQLESLPEDTFICVRRPWQRESEALLVPYPDDLRIPADVLSQGFEYFLEVPTAREALEVFVQEPTLEQMTDLVLFYAEHDAFPEWVYIA
jgi:hypothetical protein